MEFGQIAILFVVAAGAGMIAKLLKQPLLIGYLFAGVLLGSFGLVSDPHAFESLGKVGVALLLFLVGIEMNIKEIPSIGKTALLTGVGQILFTSVIGYFIAILLGFNQLSSVYIAIALTFSSTIIIVKLLSEKNELGTLHGKISMGFLLVQDFAAILILIMLAGLDSGSAGFSTFVEIVIKTFLLLGVLYALSTKVFPKLFANFIDSSGELVLIASIAWALGMSAFVGGPLGLSLEIGGFLAGLSLASLPEHLQVASKTRPLRDFFLTIFFLVLGTNLVVGNFSEILIPSLIFSIFVLIGNPLILLTIMGLMGYKKRTSLSISLTAAQISEFSMIVITMGLAIGHVTSSIVSIVVLVGAITMTISTYMILETDRIYHWLQKPLKIFERKNVRENFKSTDQEFNNHIVLVGADRTGNIIMRYLKSKKEDFVVVDYNPAIVASLTEKNVPAIFGDVNDPDVGEAANVKNAKLIIATYNNLHDSLLLLNNLKGLRKKPVVILKTYSNKTALHLYNEGASYVVLPEIVTGEHIRHLIKQYTSLSKINKLGISHKKRLKR